MSLRYVWNRSTIKWALSIGNYLNGYSVNAISGIVDSSSAILSADVYDELTVDANTGAISGVKTGTESVTVQFSYGGDYYYLNPTKGNYFSPYLKVDGKTYYIGTEKTDAQNPSSRQYYVRNKNSSESGLEARLYYSDNRQSNYFSSSAGNCNSVRSGQAANEYLDTVSNASSATYPPRDYASKFANIWP